MAHERVAFIAGLGAIPMQVLARVVLLIPDPRQLSDCRNSVGEVVKEAGRYRDLLA